MGDQARGVGEWSVEEWETITISGYNIVDVAEVSSKLDGLRLAALGQGKLP